MTRTKTIEWIALSTCWYVHVILCRWERFIVGYCGPMLGSAAHCLTLRFFDGHGISHSFIDRAVLWQVIRNYWCFQCIHANYCLVSLLIMSITCNGLREVNTKLDTGAKFDTCTCVSFFSYYWDTPVLKLPHAMISFFLVSHVIILFNVIVL